MSIGDFGHLMTIIAFVSSLVATIGYFIMSKKENKGLLEEANSWKRFSRITFYIHTTAVILIIYSLFNIIYNHRYEYHYAWQHSSNDLPVHYMISCFWEGQEGSFLLWIFWHVVLGLIIIKTNKKWESSVMTIFSFVQFFLVSMILGVVLFNYKLGSSPFILLKDAVDFPIYEMKPDFVPEDGTGLNALLQNIWMVIHPPTLFLGFALTLVPFAYAIAGLWTKRYDEWIRPALPWTLVGGAILGLGILMGGYWAYETLNFGGYWNWDPVENAVYVPWLVLVAGFHVMIIYRKKNAGSTLRVALLLTIATFILILYSTFLTRSGVLGDASVHSFTDLGLTGQLLIYLLTFTILSLFLLFKRWGKIPSNEVELSLYTRELWVFIGAAVLCLGAIHVLFFTSIPFFNWVFEQFGIIANMAPPTDPVEFYTNWQFWMAVFIAILSGTGQFFWWKKISKEKLKKTIYPPIIVTFLVSSIFILIGKIHNIYFILLLTVSFYSIIANLFILVGLLKKKIYKLTGGAITHIGIAMMLIGILFSAGYSKVVSLNLTGKLYTTEEGEIAEKFNKENVFLEYNRPAKMNGYDITYKGSYIRAKNFGGYIPVNALLNTENEQEKVTQNPIMLNGRTYYERGDTLHIISENMYHKIEYKDQKGRIFNLFPRIQFNDQMGTIASPDIKRWLGKDLYTHISYPFPNPNRPREWSKLEEKAVAIKDTFMVGDYFAILEKVKKIGNNDKLIGKTDAAAEATVKVLGKERNFILKPKFYIKGDMLGRPPVLLDDIGIELTLLKIDPQAEKYIFGIRTAEKPYVIMKAIEKPMINVLWIGTIVVMMGFMIAIMRRYQEFKKMRDKGVE